MVKTTVIDQHRSKKCTKCKVLKTTKDFSFQNRPGSAKGGPLGKRKKTCKQCMSITNKAYNKANRSKHKPRKRREYLRRERALGKTPKLRDNELPIEQWDKNRKLKAKAVLQRLVDTARKQVEQACKLANSAKTALAALERKLNALEE